MHINVQLEITNIAYSIHYLYLKHNLEYSKVSCQNYFTFSIVLLFAYKAELKNDMGISKTLQGTKEYLQQHIPLCIALQLINRTRIYPKARLFSFPESINLH